MEKAKPWLDRLHASIEKSDYLQNKDIGQVRRMAGGKKLFWMNKNGLSHLNAGFGESVNPEFTAVGASLNARQIDQVVNNLRLQNNPWATDIENSLHAAQDAQGNATIVAMPGKGQSLREALATLREELNHDWQKAFGDAANEHFGKEKFAELSASIPEQALIKLRQQGYTAEAGTEQGDRMLVLETSAKLLSDRPETLGLSEDEAADWLFEYLDAVEQEHGANAVNELVHITKFAKEVREKFRASTEKQKNLKVDYAEHSAREYTPGHWGVYDKNGAWVAATSGSSAEEAIRKVLSTSGAKGFAALATADMGDAAKAGTTQWKPTEKGWEGSLNGRIFTIEREGSGYYVDEKDGQFGRMARTMDEAMRYVEEYAKSSS
jgi:hypothetical protein